VIEINQMEVAMKNSETNLKVQKNENAQTDMAGICRE
jgi:hypothetical protein